MDVQQVAFEHSVGGAGRHGGRVDIALKGSRGVVALIEAKAPGTDLSSNVSQVLGYAFHEGADICALTTGLEWWLYLPYKKGAPEERRFAVLNLNHDPVEQLAGDLERFLGYRSLETGNAVAQAERTLNAQHESAVLNEMIPSIWRKMLEEPDEELLELISERVHNEIDLRPERQQVVAVLEDTSPPASSAPITPTTTPGPESRPDPTASSSPSEDQVHVVFDAAWPTAFVAFGKRYPIKSNAQGYVRLLEVLYQRDPGGFSKLSELAGIKYKFISKNRAELRRGANPRQIGSSGYLADVNLNASVMWERARQFMRHLGYSDSDLELQVDD